jgi:hypothetical protein
MIKGYLLSINETTVDWRKWRCVMGLTPAVVGLGFAALDMPNGAHASIW